MPSQRATYLQNRACVFLLEKSKMIPFVVSKSLPDIMWNIVDSRNFKVWTNLGFYHQCSWNVYTFVLIILVQQSVGLSEMRDHQNLSENSKEKREQRNYQVEKYSIHSVSFPCQNDILKLCMKIGKCSYAFIHRSLLQSLSLINRGILVVQSVCMNLLLLMIYL